MHIVVFVTACGKKEAKKIAGKLLKLKLAACVNILCGVESFFRWQGKIDSAKEAMLVIKTKKEKLGAVIKCVKSAHSYELPEIIALPVVAGYAPYLKWIDESLRQPV